MNKQRILLLLAVLLLVVSLFLPYFEYDRVERYSPNILTDLLGGLSKSYFRDQLLYSYETFLGYFPLILILYPILQFLRDSQRAVRSVKITGFILTGWIIVLYFFLTAEPSFYNGYCNVRPQWGYLLQFLVGVLLLIAGFNVKIKPGKGESDELLDSSI